MISHKQLEEYFPAPFKKRMRKQYFQNEMSLHNNKAKEE